MPAPHVELLLARHADTAWRGAIRPWLEAGHGRLTRSYAVVATRGQAQGLKQRCVSENLALLGVEFLSPGLARQKWLPLVATKPVLGRELLLFELKIAIAQRLQSLKPDDSDYGLLKSLQSDAERALDDFDELLKAGFGPADFAQAPLQEIFGQLAARIDELGYGLGAKQSEQAALAPVAAGGTKIGGRLLVYGLTAEAWGEFFNVAAFARRFDDITVVLPEPEFRGRRALDEAWVEVWQTILGTNALPLDAPPPSQSCEYIASWWGGTAQNETTAVAEDSPQRVLVGETRTDEMRLVADEVVRLVDAGADEMAVVFPKADAAHTQLARLLREREIAFVDLLPGVGAPSLETQLQRALLAFYEQGGRLEELLTLWPLLRASGLTEVPTGTARGVCERLFDERQTHAVATYAESFAGKTRPEWKEVNRVVSLLLPLWPAELTLADALKRFQTVCESLSLALPAGWPALAAFAEREQRVLPLQEIFAALASFIPEKAPATGRTASNGFARVTLTTRRRAEGLAWSHVILVESNAGVWPQRQSSSGWLTDEHRTALNVRGRFSLGVFGADDLAWLEKRGYAALARDAGQMIFSAALADEAEPEARLAPNSWLERVLWRTGVAGGDVQAAFERRAVAALTREPVVALESWLKIWNSRRNPAQAFDDYFLSVDPVLIKPEKLSARLIEAAVGDPAELWFGAVFGAARVESGPFLRSSQRALGQLAHRVVAAALRGDFAEGAFFEKPSRDDAAGRLEQELLRTRALWPADRFWDSFHAGLEHACLTLLENLFQLETGRIMATEVRLPAAASVPIGAKGERLAVTGRMDAVFLDRVDWTGAAVEIVDFKTGGDALLSAARMARKGSALQLGVYLAAAQSLGATSGRVWMIKPEAGGVASMDMGELPQALLPLETIARHLETGRYGALTPDKSAHASAGFVWPLACAPIPEAVLADKFAVTFGVAGEEMEGQADE
jgi:hypothetical protein